jgi:hypothetical protein
VTRAHAFLALILSAALMGLVIMLDQGLSGATAMNPILPGGYAASCLVFATYLATGRGEERQVTWARWYAALPWLLFVAMCIYANELR